MLQQLKKLFIIILFIFPLSGCIPAAFVVGAAAGGSIIYDKRPVKTMMHDRHISQTSQNLIDQDPQLQDHSHISIAAFNGIVLMVGQAATPQLRQHAYDLVNQVKGIKRIYNEVTVSGNTSLLTRSNDAWITGKIKSAMLAKPGLQSSQIKVITEDGIAYLMGLVSQKQAALAVDAARKISGVRKVVKVFQYT